ncbi:phage head-tail connector protein [Clostridium arbusti]|uniref:phage head-tail connector protein n=1 Tax=Clostridium arbusti TaxID=1137848 RepID=UPI000288E016|nr:phage head-tail connector protein [Clostridium arbusti]
MAILDDAKIILNVSNQDALINLYLRQGSTLIKNYLKIDNLDVEATYPDSLLQYTVETFRKHGLEGTKQFSQGSRSGTFTDGLSNDVKALLPLPYIRLMG